MPECSSHLGRELDKVYETATCPTCGHEHQDLVGLVCVVCGDKYDAAGVKIVPEPEVVPEPAPAFTSEPALPFDPDPNPGPPYPDAAQTA